MNIQAFDFSVNLLQVLLWQHNKADRLQALLGKKQAWFNQNQQAFWENWYRDVFDLTTANDFGLSIWAIILGVPLVVAPAPDLPGKPFWGFGQYRKNYTHGNFAASSTGAGLTTAQQRIVLRLRYFQLVTRGAAPEINAFLAKVFGPGVVRVVDNLDMSCTYYFANAIPANLSLILQEYDILPRPAGVSVSYAVG